MPLKDKSKIVYQTIDREKNLFVDVYWIRSADEIWRMKTLSTDPARPVGFYVDKLKRNSGGDFSKEASFPTYHFTQFKWEVDP